LTAFLARGVIPLNPSKHSFAGFDSHPDLSNSYSLGSEWLATASKKSEKKLGDCSE